MRERCAVTHQQCFFNFLEASSCRIFWLPGEADPIWLQSEGILDNTLGKQPVFRDFFVPLKIDLFFFIYLTFYTLCILYKNLVYIKYIFYCWTFYQASNPHLLIPSLFFFNNSLWHMNSVFLKASCKSCQIKFAAKADFKYDDFFQRKDGIWLS